MVTVTENSSKYSKIPLLFISFLYNHLQIARDYTVGWTILKGREMYLMGVVSSHLFCPLDTSYRSSQSGSHVHCTTLLSGTKCTKCRTEVKYRSRRLRGENVKFCVYAMMTQRERRIQVPLILILAPDGSERLTSHLSCFTPRETATSIH
jgi:hypothetical protein